jgi:CDP-diacylglycerol--serine O-phosphatidyltransferase
VARRRRFHRDRVPFLLLLPSLVTILGLSAGLTSIRFVFDGRFELAAALIVFAAVIDGFDGLIARRLNAASPFGAELDSLSDFLCFGVAPAVLVFRYGLIETGGLGWTFALVFAICCCLRLARFNITRDVPLAPGGRPHFTGVPAPAGALLALLPVFLSLEGILDARSLPFLVAPWLAIVGVLMVSRLQTFSPKSLRISRDMAGVLLVGMAILVGVMFTRFWLLMVLLDTIYTISLVHALAIARRRPQT